MKKVEGNWFLAIACLDVRTRQKKAKKTRRRWRVPLVFAWAVVLLCCIPYQTNANYNPPVCLPPNAASLPSVGEQVDTVMYFTNGKTIECTITESWYCGGFVHLTGTHPVSFYTVNPKDPYVVQLVRWDFGMNPNATYGYYGYYINVTTAVISSSPVPSYTPSPDTGKPECSNQIPMN